MATIIQCDKCKKEQTREDRHDWSMINIFRGHCKIEKFGEQSQFQYCLECTGKILPKIAKIL